MQGKPLQCRDRVAHAVGMPARANAAGGDAPLPIHTREAKRSVRIWERPNSPTYLLRASSKLFGGRKGGPVSACPRASPRPSERICWEASALPTPDAGSVVRHLPELTKRADSCC